MKCLLFKQNNFKEKSVSIVGEVWETQNAIKTIALRGPTEDIIHYFTLMSSELHYLDIIPKIENFTLMSSTL